MYRLDVHHAARPRCSFSCILLRSDLHSLFDDGLLRIEPSAFTLVLDPSLADTSCWSLNGTTLRPWLDESQSSREYLGNCGDSSPPIVGPPSAYPPLRAGSGGTARAEAHVPVELNEARRYIVNVHASPTNLGTIIACGALED